MTIALLATRKIDGRDGRRLHRRPARRRVHRRRPDARHPDRQRPGRRSGLGAVVGQRQRRPRRRLRGRGHRHGDPRVHGLRRGGRRARRPAGFAGHRHRLHRLRDHHPRRPDHRRRPQPGPPDRPGAPRAGHRRDHRPGRAAVVVYIAGPIVGGLVGAFLYEFIGREAPAGTGLGAPAAEGRAPDASTIRQSTPRLPKEDTHGHERTQPG